MGQDDNISPQVIPETLFTIFLEESPNPDIFLFYSTNYAVMESLAQVIHLTSQDSPCGCSFKRKLVGKTFELLNLFLMFFGD